MGQRAIPSWINRHSYHSAEQTVKNKKLDHRVLGSLLVARFQAAAFKRAAIPEEERLDFYLTIDEFQNFMTESFASILSEARKYRLCLTMAHQYLGQAKPAVREAVFGNVGSMIAFRVGGPDGEALEQVFSPDMLR